MSDNALDSLEIIAGYHEIEKENETGVVDVSFKIAGKQLNYIGLKKEDIRESGYEVLKSNKESADEQYDRIIQETKYNPDDSAYEDDKKHDKRLSGMIECIQLYPGDKRYFNAILDDIFKADQVEFYEFVQYWHLQDMFPNLTPRRRIISK